MLHLNSLSVSPFSNQLAYQSFSIKRFVVLRILDLFALFPRPCTHLDQHDSIIACPFHSQLISLLLILARDLIMSGQHFPKRKKGSNKLQLQPRPNSSPDDQFGSAWSLIRVPSTSFASRLPLD
jgi:hypothetical protein